MLNSTQATAISDAQTTGATVDSLLLSETSTGKRIMDEANHAVLWAAKSGLYTTPLEIGNYPDAVVDEAITLLTGLGYTIDETRRTSYKDLILAW